MDGIPVFTNVSLPVDDGDCRCPFCDTSSANASSFSLGPEWQFGWPNYVPGGSNQLSVQLVGTTSLCFTHFKLTLLYVPVPFGPWTVDGVQPLYGLAAGGTPVYVFGGK